MKTRNDTNDSSKRMNRKRPMGKILTLKERVLAIKAYYRKPIYSKVAEKFKCDWEQIKTIIQERKAILDYYEMATAHVTTLSLDELITRRQKLTLLGGCMYEYIQRAQYHKNAVLDDKVLIAQAAEFSYHIRIKNFIPTKSWLKQFKISYKIPFSEQKIQLTRTPRASLNPKKILAFCKDLIDSKYLQIDLQTGKKDGKSEDPQANNTLTSSKSKSKAHKTVESESRQRRRQKINLLEKALYEFIQRAQYHRKILLNEDLHIKVACELNDMLEIENFTPNKNWIRHFKLHFNINTSQRMIIVNRIPPSSLDLKDILSYCREMDSKNNNVSLAAVSIKREDAHIEDNDKEQQQNSQPKLILNSGVKPDTIVTLEFHNVDEEDIKPDMTDIEFELLEDDDDMEHPSFKIQQIESMQVDKTTSEQPANSFDHCSDEEDIKPDISNIKIQILEDDMEVEQPVLKIQKIESTHHVGKSKSKDSANSSGQVSHEVTDAEVPPKHTNMDQNQTIDFSTNAIAQSRVENILSPEDRVLAIKAYDRNITLSKIAEDFNCTQEHIEKIIQHRDVAMDYYKIPNSKSNDIMVRRRKIEFLTQCMYEFIKRAQIHKYFCLDEDILLYEAAKFSRLLQISNFIASKSWLDQFKISCDIPLSQKIFLRQEPDTSLNAGKIIHYCRRLELKEEKICQYSPSSSTTKVMTTPANATPTKDELRILRQHKIDTLEKALYEYIQRSQYHRKMPLNEDLQISIACKLKNFLKIEDFFPDKSWLKHFKLHYNINTSQRMIVVNRIPPSSLNLKDILSYCCHTYRRSELTSPKTVALENVDTQESEKKQKPHLQLEEQEVPEKQIIIDLEVQPEIMVTMETSDTVDEDIKPDIMDIKIEFPQEQEQVQPLFLCTSAEKEKVHPTILENHNFDSFQMEESRDDEELPKQTKSYADALKKLKSLEEFSLLEGNYRAIGLITQLENIFKNPSKSN